jgi:hypothetical protein
MHSYERNNAFFIRFCKLPTLTSASTTSHWLVVHSSLAARLFICCCCPPRPWRLSFFPVGASSIACTSFSWVPPSGANSKGPGGASTENASAPAHRTARLSSPSASHFTTRLAARTFCPSRCFYYMKWLGQDARLMCACPSHHHNCQRCWWLNKACKLISTLCHECRILVPERRM